MAGLSQQQLAAKALISQSVISRFERGLAPGMSTERLILLAEAVGWRFPLGYCPHDHECQWVRIEPIRYDHPPARSRSFNLPVLKKSRRRRENEIAQRMFRAGAWAPGVQLSPREFAELRERATREVDDERARLA
jgi:transcriptional regulator with XRE-family HTH domain